jgi:hypothetical protein
VEIELPELELQPLELPELQDLERLLLDRLQTPPVNQNHVLVLLHVLLVKYHQG